MCPFSPKKLKREKLNRGVSFDHIQFHEFAPAIGDNPFVSGGVPIALGTKLNESVLPLDQYEESRGPRRFGRQLSLTRKDRKAL